MEDFVVECIGGYWIFTPRTPRAERWLTGNLFPQKYKVEARKGPPIVRALLSEGFGVIKSESHSEVSPQ